MSGSTRRELIRTVIRMLRWLLPVGLICSSLYAIVVNWEAIRAFFSVCTLGAVIGGTAALFLSRRSFNAFSPRVLLTGAAAGAFLACLLSYNILDVSSNLSVLFYTMMPLAIMLYAIYRLIRGVL